MEKAKKIFGGVQYVDIELHLKDNRILIGELECAPQEDVTVDLAALPSWLRFA